MNELYYKLLRNLNYIVDVHGGGDRFHFSLINENKNPRLYLNIYTTPRRANEKGIIGEVTINQKLFVEGKYMPELTKLAAIEFKENDNFTAIVRKIKKIARKIIGQ